MHPSVVVFLLWAGGDWLEACVGVGDAWSTTGSMLDAGMFGRVSWAWWRLIEVFCAWRTDIGLEGLWETQGQRGNPCLGGLDTHSSMRVAGGGLTKVIGSEEVRGEEEDTA